MSDVAREVFLVTRNEKNELLALMQGKSRQALGCVIIIISEQIFQNHTSQRSFDSKSFVKVD